MFHVKHLLKQRLKNLNISPEDKKIDYLNRYIEELLRWNENINLISRRLTKEEIVNKLIIPSLIPHNILSPGEKVLDFGAGAGIVGIPLAIILPKLRVDLLESKEKTIYFLRHIKNILSLDVGIIQKYVKQPKELPRHFDAILVRAVDPEKVPPGIGGKIIYYGEYKGNKLKIENTIEWKNWKVSILLT